MTFSLECQMTVPVEQWLCGQGLTVRREFATAWGICDLVGCSFNKRNVKKRLAFGQRKPVGSQLRVMMLSAIPDERDAHEISLTALHSKFGNLIDSHTIAREVGRLVRDKFVKHTPKGNLQKLNGWVPLHKRLIAVELKLDRISEVLYQAVSNLEFADESYVGLPMQRAIRLRNSTNVSEFATKGIGILGIASSRCEVLLKADPDKTRPNPVIQMHSVERFWRAYPKGS